MGRQGSAERRVFSVGHSNRALEDFLSLLKAHRIETLIDVRTVPKSRHVPHFNKDVLSGALERLKINYLHFPKLGGLRKASPASANTGWKNASFRGFADHMQTGEFLAGLAELLIEADRSTVAILCAEAVPWRCHRSLIADALLIRGLAVEHILSPTRTHSHQLTSFAHVAGTRVTYPDLLQGEVS